MDIDEDNMLETDDGRLSDSAITHHKTECKDKMYTYLDAWFSDHL